MTIAHEDIMKDELDAALQLIEDLKDRLLAMKAECISMEEVAELRIARMNELEAYEANQAHERMMRCSRHEWANQRAKTRRIS